MTDPADYTAEEQALVERARRHRAQAMAGAGATCRSCGARIVWAVTSAGRRMPVDRESSEAGTVSLVVGAAGDLLALVLKGEGIRLARKHEHPLHTAHFATCPEAAKHRRKR